MCNMSDVRLSNASPTLERVDTRQPDPTRPPISRNLFGPLDREEFRREVQVRTREGERAFTERWNFDVVNDRPLSPGNFTWEAVVAPGFYSRPPHRRRCPGENVDCNCNNNREDVERNGGQSGTDSPSASLRKRPANRSGCSSECQSKRSHTDDDDDKDQSDKVERTPCKPESRGL